MQQCVFSTRQPTSLSSRLRIQLLSVCPSPPGSSISSYSDLKPAKSVSRKRWARAVSYELGGDLYAVDLEEGYRPLGPRNMSWGRDWSGGVGGEEDRDNEEEESSGIGPAAKPTSSKSLTPLSALKVTYRCCSLRPAAPP